MRRCEMCNKQLPEEAPARRRYCLDKCRKRAERARRKAERLMGRAESELIELISGKVNQ